MKKKKTNQTLVSSPSRSLGIIIIAVLLPVFLPGQLYPVDMIADGNMETGGTANWPLTDISAVNSCAKASDHLQSGSQSLKCTSQSGRRRTVGWYDAQTVGVVSSSGTVQLSLWYGYQALLSSNRANGTVYYDIKPASGTWTNVWSQPLTFTTSFQSGSISGTDISASFTTTESYDIRLRFEGRTGNNNSAQVIAWWDSVVMDVTSFTPSPSPSPTPLDLPPPPGCIRMSVVWVSSGMHHIQAGSLQ